MNRESFQRFALATIAVLLVALAVQGPRWRPFSSCRVDRHVEHRVDGHIRMAQIAPLPPLPPMPPLPPAPPPPPPPTAAFTADADVAREIARHEADLARHEAEVRRHVEIHARVIDAHARQMERRVRRVAPPPMVAVAVASRDEVLFERTFPFRSGDRLVVGLSSEDVVVEPASGAQASVRVVGRGRDARAEFERRRFSAGYAGGVLRVRTNPARQAMRVRSLQAGYTVTIRVPVEANVEVSTASGDVRVARADGRTFAASTASGDVSVGTVRADRITVSTASGDVDAQALDGEAEVSTASGDVTVARLAGRRARVSTSSGDISVRDAATARFEASTSSGDVDAHRLAGPARVSTASGDVTLAFARAYAVEVSTGSGDVEIGLPRGAGAAVNLSSGSIQFDSALAFQGERGRRSATGRIGGGGPPIDVSTGGGSVALNVR